MSKRDGPKIIFFENKELELPPAEIDLKKLEAAVGVNLHGSGEAAQFLVDAVRDYFKTKDIPERELRWIRRQRKNTGRDYSKLEGGPRLHRRFILSVYIRSIEEELTQHDPTYVLKAGTRTINKRKVTMAH